MPTRTFPPWDGYNHVHMSQKLMFFLPRVFNTGPSFAKINLHLLRSVNNLSRLNKHVATFTFVALLEHLLVGTPPWEEKFYTNGNSTFVERA